MRFYDSTAIPSRSIVTLEIIAFEICLHNPPPPPRRNNTSRAHNTIFFYDNVSHLCALEDVLMRIVGEVLQRGHLSQRVFVRPPLHLQHSVQAELLQEKEEPTSSLSSHRQSVVEQWLKNIQTSSTKKKPTIYTMVTKSVEVRSHG